VTPVSHCRFTVLDDTIRKESESLIFSLENHAEKMMLKSDGGSCVHRSISVTGGILPFGICADLETRLDQIDAVLPSSRGEKLHRCLLVDLPASLATPLILINNNTSDQGILASGR
jgi:hypothetical protein